MRKIHILLIAMFLTPLTLMAQDQGESGDDNTERNPEITLLCNILPKSVTPTDGTHLEELNGFTITFDQPMYLNPQIYVPVIYNKIRESYSAVWIASEDNRTYTLQMAETVTEPNTYVMAIVPGTFGDAEALETGFTTGRGNEDFMTVVFIDGKYSPLQYDYLPKRVTPEEGYLKTPDPLNEILVLFDADSIKYEWITTNLCLFHESDIEIPLIANSHEDEEGATLRLNTRTPLTLDGEYRLWLPRDTFGTEDWWNSGTKAGRTNPEIIFTWNVSAETIAMTASQSEDVPQWYNLQGLPISEPHPGSQTICIKSQNNQPQKVFVK